MWRQFDHCFIGKFDVFPKCCQFQDEFQCIFYIRLVEQVFSCFGSRKRSVGWFLYNVISFPFPFLSSFLDGAFLFTRWLLVLKCWMTLEQDVFGTFEVNKVSDNLLCSLCRTKVCCCNASMSNRGIFHQWLTNINWRSFSSCLQRCKFLGHPGVSIKTICYCFTILSFF